MGNTEYAIGIYCNFIYSIIKYTFALSFEKLTKNIPFLHPCCIPRFKLKNQKTNIQGKI